MLKNLRYLLFPLSAIYGSVIWLRNFSFDKNILKSSAFNFPIICVGNLAMGGTGKSPMVEYLLRLLKNKYKVATLSRGYKRKTSGFAIANANTTALDIGDEPMQFHKKFPDVTVAVAEERLVAIPQLLHDKPETQVIILDDAFQHRHIRAGLNILLTDYNNLYTRDVILPAGNLRDVKSSGKRANIIAVTKCPADLNEDDKNKIVKELEVLQHQRIFFTKLEYDSPYNLFTNQEMRLDSETHILLICGIANPKPIKEFLNAYSITYDMIIFNDHHIFDMDDLKKIKQQFEKIETANKIILTTEKDSVRLEKFANELKEFPVFVLPVKHEIMFGEEEIFNKLILNFIKSLQIAYN